MATKIQLRNSVVKDKAPLPSELVIGEVCVGAHEDSPMLIFKDNADNIVKIKPGSGVTPGPDAPDSPSAGDLWFDTDTSLLYYFNGSSWVELGTAGDSPVISVNGEVGAVVLTAADVGAVTIGDVNPTYFANQAAFPDASSSAVHGGVAHSHADGAMFFAHNGTWNELANASDVGGGLWELVGNSVEPITPNQNVVVPEKLYVGVRNPDVADDGGLITYDATYNEFILDCVKSNLTANLKLDGRITVGTVTAANFDIDALDPLPA